MSLIELFLALSLSIGILAATLGLTSMMTLNQAYAARQTRLEGEASRGWRALEDRLRRSTEVLWPLRVGDPSDLLSVCENHESRLGAGASGDIDVSEPSKGSTFCVEGGRLYVHSGACPVGAPSCGKEGALLLAVGLERLPGSTAFFSRPAPGLVRFAFQASSGERSRPRVVDVTVALNSSSEEGS